MSNYNTYQIQAKEYLDISVDTNTNDLTFGSSCTFTQGITMSSLDVENLTVNSTLTTDNLSVSGTIGATGTSTFYGTVNTNDGLNVSSGMKIQSGGIGVTGTTTVYGTANFSGTSNFYGEVFAYDYLIGTVPYYYVSVNNATNTYTSITNGYSIVYEMAANSYESASKGLTYYTSGGSQASYFQPTNSGIYLMTFMCRIKDADNADNPSIEPYIYSRTSSAASWILSTSQPAFAATNQSVNASALYLNYTQPIYVPSGGDTNIDLRAYTTSGTFNISWGTFSLTFVSAL